MMTLGGAAASGQTQIEGSIEKIVFQNSLTGFAVLRVCCPEYSNPVTVVGPIDWPYLGEQLKAWGSWTQGDYGSQFNIQKVQLTPPIGPHEALVFLRSGALRSLPPEVLSQLSPQNAFYLLQSSESLAHHPTPSNLPLPPELMERVREDWREFKVLREIASFLRIHQLPIRLTLPLFHEFGIHAVEELSSKPYTLLLKFPYLPFKTVDQLNAGSTLHPESPDRCKAAIEYCLERRMRQGHSAYPLVNILREAQWLLRLDPSPLKKVIEDETKRGHLVISEIDSFECLSRSQCRERELFIGQKLRERARGLRERLIPSFDKTLQKLEKNGGLHLTSQQKLALHGAITNDLCIIDGGPHSGKSLVLKILSDLLKVELLTLEPIASAEGGLALKTGLTQNGDVNPIERFNASRVFPQNGSPLKLLAIQKAHLLCEELAFEILKVLPQDCRLLLIGDYAQEPPFKGSSIYRFLVDSKMAPIVKLPLWMAPKTKPCPRLQICHQIREGELPDLEPHRLSDFFFLETASIDSTLGTLWNVVFERLPRSYSLDPNFDVQILTLQKQGPLGSQAINRFFQEQRQKVNGSQYDYYFGQNLIQGEKVRVKDPENLNVKNSEVGVVETIKKTTQELTIHFQKSHRTYSYNQLNSLEKAYALPFVEINEKTFPFVIIPLESRHLKYGSINQLYSAMTRSTNKIIFIGPRKVFSAIIKKVHKQKSWSFLNVTDQKSHSQREGEKS